MVNGIIFGILADMIMSKGWLTKPNVRKLMHGIGFGLPAITAALLGYTTANWVLCITVLSLGFGFRAAQYCGHYSLIYDIAPKFSGTVYGMVNMCGNTAGFITPLLASELTGADPTDITGWRNLFWLASGLLATGLVLFMAFVKFEPAKFEYDTEKDLMVTANGGVGSLDPEVASPTASLVSAGRAKATEIPSSPTHLRT